jgi:acyl transferase domain-containing protein/acyl carrier protein
MGERGMDTNHTNGVVHGAARNGTRAIAGAETIQAWLVDRLAELLEIEIEEVDVAEPFASYGLGSTELVSLSGELSEWLGRDLPAELAYEFPTIEALARRLAEPEISPTPAVVANGNANSIPVRDTNQDAIAIIGIGCRFPGANNALAFWDLLQGGIDAISEVPAERFSLDDYYDSDPAAAGKIVTRFGGFIDHVDQFDAHFFGISPREAARMDPQQRVLLEVAWDALEDAGQVRDRLAGTNTGVFIGISNNDYGRIQFSDVNRIDAYAGTGNALSIAANRISYVFDFHGPSLAVDTACSSSLVAVHQACNSLRSGESTLALAGGVNLILSPAITINFSKAGAMAPDGRCKTFDARANGYVRGEGAGVVVLKPLAQALADGDSIYAVIRGSAVNQDGRSNGLMAPNPRAQEAVLRAAYLSAGVAAADVQYVEAHGTGTLLGDPIEAKALGAVLALDRRPNSPCLLGSVKTNLGHLEAAAGIAGLIKVALSLKHRVLPASLHFKEPNPHIPFDQLPLRVNTALCEWPAPPDTLMLAGVSSFGFGGTNVHVVVQGAPEAAAAPQAALATEDRAADTTYLLPLSARSEPALKALARSYRDFLNAPGPARSLYDICYAASARRSHHEYRLAAAGNSAAQLADALDAFIAGETRPGLSSGRKLSDRQRKLVFVFPGQGAQWFGMGRELLKTEPVFRDAIERCDRAMRPYGDWSMLKELEAAAASQSRLSEIDILQPALFAIQVALAALWRSWGIEPHAVVGHSMGEVAAAHVAGALSLDDAVRVICSRSRLVKPAIGRGAMAAVDLSIADARRAIAGYEDRVSIAVSNGPTSTVLSGDPAALEAIVARLQSRDIFGRMIKVDFAAHSPDMEPLRADLKLALEGIQPQPPSVPLYSTVTGRDAEDLTLDPDYWSRNLREPVLFSAAVEQLLAGGHDIFLEISPHPILLSAIQQEFRHTGLEGAAIPSLRRDEQENKVLTSSLGALYAIGYPIEWSRFYSVAGRPIQLPAYPWQRERFWMDPPEMVTREVGAAKHSLLGRHFKSAQSETHYWEGTLDSMLPYLHDHRIEGVAVLPAALYLEMAFAAAAEAFPSHSFTLQDVDLLKALFVGEGETRATQLVLSPSADATSSIHIYSRANENESWTLHTSATLSADAKPAIEQETLQESLAQLKTRCTEQISGADHYRKLGEVGVTYGPSFQTVAGLWRGANETIAELKAPDEPVRQLLDACFQTFAAALTAEQTTWMPTHIDEVRVDAGHRSNLWTHAHLQAPDANSIKGDVRLLDEAGKAAVEIVGMRFDSIGRTANLDDWLYEFQWRLLEPPAVSAPADSGSWLIFADSGGVGEKLAAQIKDSGQRSIVVSHGESYERTDAEHFRINAERPDDMRQLIEAVTVQGQPPCRAVVHLWSLDASFHDQTNLNSLATAQSLGCNSVLHLVQALARVESDHLPHLWLVTRGAQLAGDTSMPLNIAQSPLWGLGRVVAQEHPAFWGGLIDLDPNPEAAADAATHLCRQISSSDGEDQLAFRDGRRYAGRLIRKPRIVAQPAPMSWRADATYLVTGGLGELGLSVARWMVEQGARRLILMARSKLPPRAEWNSVDAGSEPANRIAAIRELEAMGASVHLASVDVADEDQLSAYIDSYRAEGWPPIRGVVHAAGVLHDGLLAQLDRQAFDSVMRPKVTGGWLLHQMLADAPLDFFVMFSSAGSLLGQPGQGNYAAANSFLDALAHHRRALGKPALSINWGAWNGLGFAETAGGKRLAARLALAGIGSIAPAQALEVMGRMLSHGATQVAVVPVDWGKYRQFYPAGTEAALLSELGGEQTASSARSGDVSEKRTALLAAEPAERFQLVQSYVTELVARVLGQAASKVDVQQPLSNLGLDSLMAVELKNRIATDLGVNIPMVTFLSGPSVEQAATQLLRLLGEAPAASVPSASQDIVDQAPPQDVDQYSDEQVNSMLTELLAKEGARE